MDADEAEERRQLWAGDAVRPAAVVDRTLVCGLAFRRGSGQA